MSQTLAPMRFAGRMPARTYRRTWLSSTPMRPAASAGVRRSFMQEIYPITGNGQAKCKRLHLGKMLPAGDGRKYGPRKHAGLHGPATASSASALFGGKRDPDGQGFAAVGRVIKGGQGDPGGAGTRTSP